jgi:tRNA-specific 2-thiouridylase
VLYHLDHERLEHLVFPLGEMAKPETRAHARRLGLPVADKPDSQEICFIPRGRTGDYLAGRLPVREGELVTAGGRRVGRHRGVPLYTVGQRHGFGDLSEPGPWYVLRVDAAANRVVVGRREELGTTRVRLRDVTFIAPTPPAATLDCEARLRYRAPPVTATYAEGLLTLEEPFPGVAPGQAAVLYRGSRVLGGGTIAAA